MAAMFGMNHGVDLASIEWIAWQPVRIPDWKAPNWLNLTTAPAGRDQLGHLLCIDAWAQ